MMNGENALLNIQDDQSEKLRYNHPGEPIYLRTGVLSVFPGYAAAAHWHDDIELILCLDGKMNYSVDGTIVPMKKGGGIFVNSRRIHFGFSDDYSECRYLCIVFHPMTVMTNPVVKRKFIDPLTGNEHLSFIALHGEDAEDEKLLELMQSLLPYADLDGEHDPKWNELKIISILLLVWNELTMLMEDAGRSQPPAGSAGRPDDLAALQNMLKEIHKNYASTLTLSDIARAGNVGKTKCTALFHAYLHTTPNQFLTGYRLQKAAELLRRTSLTVAEIAEQTGFAEASYLTEVFQKNYGCSSREFRQRSRAGNDSRS